MFYSAFKIVLGRNGTLLIPTFTYSYSNGKIYNPNKSKNICGLLSEEFQKKREGKTYLDPNISYVVFGKFKDYFTSAVPYNSYGKNSLFEKFYNLNGKICNFNLDAGSTFIHYLERKLLVSYRFDKEFCGKTIIGKKKFDSCNSIYVKKKKYKKEVSFKKFTDVCVNLNKFKTAKIGRGFVGVISSKNCYEILKKELRKNYFFLLKWA